MGRSWTNSEQAEDPAPDGTPSAPDWLPGWIHQVGAAVWVCDPEQRLVYVNDRAAGILAPGSALGRRCFDCFAGRDIDGRPVCSSSCEHRRRAEEGLDLVPAIWRQVGSSERWLILMPIPLKAPDGSGTWVLHLAQELGDVARVRRYLERIAHRGPDMHPPRQRLARLSMREREILELLVADQHPSAIARKLYLSVATVRNHVQHVLAKLGVHSAQEAVALHLLYGGGVVPEDDSPATPR